MTLVTFGQIFAQSCDSIASHYNEVRNRYGEVSTLESWTALNNMVEGVKESGCTPLLSSIYRNRGIQEMYMNELQQAETSLRQSVELAYQVEDRAYLGSGYHTLGSIFLQGSDHDSALKYYELALTTLHGSDLHYLDNALYQDITNVYLSTDRFSKANQYAVLMYEQARLDSNELALCSARQLLALIDMNLNGVSEETYQELRSSLSCFRRLDDSRSVLAVYENIGLAHERDGNEDSSLFYYTMASSQADSMNSSFDLAYMNKSTANLSRLIQQKNDLQSYMIYILIVLAVIIAFVAMLLLKTRKRKLIIQGQKINQLVKDQEIKAMDAMLNGQDRERRRIAEELHDRLGAMLGAIKMHYNTVENQINQLQEQARKEYEATGSLIDETAEEVRRISNDLYSGILINYGLKAALAELEQLFQGHDDTSFQWHYEHIARRFDSEIEINVYRIIQEAIANALKHAKASEVTVQINDLGNELTVMIEDNGKGFAPDRVERGMGLNNIESRAHRVGGQSGIDSHPGRGTTVSIQIPISE